MGEVYHADDLMLGQPVALKFLPETTSRNPRARRRLRNEVRIARQIAHPNVCRVYDIGEVEGLLFLSMEYIKGEDLRSLLRRIGRFPPDRALDLAVELASGLAAAHDRGVLHRDLKPANVMLDERGRARITDFGLAAAVDELETKDIRSGTPAYMAPEQSAGREVTERSDIYSLALVLYEIFTGRRAFETAGEQKDAPASVPMPPSRLVEGIDPAVERVLLRCLEKEPAKRPAAAIAVRAALPGGDRLAAAVARGETPAPGLVAEAGDFEGLAPSVAWACLVATLLSLAAGIWTYGRTRVSQIVPLPRSTELLVSDARSVLQSLGHPTPQRDSNYGFSRDTSYIEYLVERDRSPDRWQRLARGQPSVIRFWYRESPTYLVPHRITQFYPTERDPPVSVPGMVSLELDPRGRLTRLQAVPGGAWPAPAEASKPDWQALFEAAGLDPERFTRIPSRWLPSMYADTRAAWEGRYPDAPEIPIRIEAASFRGRPVNFRILEPWTDPPWSGAGGSPFVGPADFVRDDWARLAHIGFHLLFMLLLALLARRNLKKGRGDRKLAFRLACFFFAMVMLHWLFGAHHVPDGSQLEIFIGGLYRSFFAAGLAWLFYIALEPYARRLWPRSMISWVRLLDGRLRDPIVGRDVLAGSVFGIVSAFVFQIPRAAHLFFDVPALRPDLPRHPAELVALVDASSSLSALFAIQVNTLIFVLFKIGGLVLIRFVFRTTWLTVAVHYVIYVFVFSSGWPLGLLTVGLHGLSWYYVFFRFGWVSIAVSTFLIDLLNGLPLTSDLSVWYAHATLVAVLVCLSLTLYGFRVSLGGRPLFPDLLPDVRRGPLARDVRLDAEQHVFDSAVERGGERDV